MVLRGQRVLVTGAGRGIGRAIALICAEQGAKVALMSRTEEELKAVAEEVKKAHGEEALYLPVDVTNEGQVERAVQSVVEKWGGIDILVNNAGAACEKKPAYEQSVEEFRKLLEINTVSVLSVTKSVINQSMLPNKKGKIINISSRAGKVGYKNMLPYCSSKFALEGLTAALAQDVKDLGITVNSISPGMVDTKSFPKAEGQAGVRTAESIRDGLLALMLSDETGKYIHVDEFDAAVEKGDMKKAFKNIHEDAFQV
ncbi:hypothetical protein GUITHDRAFT_87979 [Guillardia theta CCMP2712]|uniref:Ketoreductase domain-containing protein n=1 Tax=Guillardia theta (strain CCMP2712) TaxID=905079 RepID=L1J463_GUITC|nr:hypothetical protein GUITHDRAFT_87979 [Guillardia theta CCMP2712]EKX42875.1 hypothetical protein GUITHDRAFT_87979 [Guillardia theta CCMP2712]|eukprot:XP_005829855.1 hypothetical protein GUITHDRAFT_87979 [Guillardia theta CCMP2712]